jgi:hypothetical protein
VTFANAGPGKPRLPRCGDQIRSRSGSRALIPRSLSGKSNASPAVASSSRMARELRGCRAHSSCAADDVAAWSAAECWASELAPYSNRLNVSPDGTFTLTRLGKRRCSERNLGEWWWRSLIYEPLKPSQRGSLGARSVQVNNQRTAGERVLERQFRPSPARPSPQRSGAGAC